MSDLDDFMAQNKPTYRSKLQPYLSDIQTLYEHGYSEPDILRYLSEKKMLVVTRKTLHTFILKHLQATVPTNKVIECTKPIAHQKEIAAIPAQKKRPSQAQPSKPTQVEPAVKNDVPPPAKTTASLPISTENDRHPINTGFKKFNSREQRDIDDLI